MLSTSHHRGRDEHAARPRPPAGSGRSSATPSGSASGSARGLSIEPEIGLLRTADGGCRARGQRGDARVHRPPAPAARARPGGDAAAGAPAEREVAASELDLRQTTAERIARRGRPVLADAGGGCSTSRSCATARQSARELLETTRRLIEADVQPAAELVQVEANLVAKETARIGGERAPLRGPPGPGPGDRPGAGADRRAAAALGSVPQSCRPTKCRPPTRRRRFVAAALERRADLRAARERRQGGRDPAARRRERPEAPARPGLHPQLLGAGGGDGRGSFFSPLYRNVPGASSSLSARSCRGRR